MTTNPKLDYNLDEIIQEICENNKETTYPTTKNLTTNITTIPIITKNSLMSTSILANPAWYRDTNGRTGFRPIEMTNLPNLQQQTIKEAPTIIDSNQPSTSNTTQSNSIESNLNQIYELNQKLKSRSNIKKNYSKEFDSKNPSNHLKLDQIHSNNFVLNQINSNQPPSNLFNSNQTQSNQIESTQNHSNQFKPINFESNLISSKQLKLNNLESKQTPLNRFDSNESYSLNTKNQTKIHSNQSKLFNQIHSNLNQNNKKFNDLSEKKSVTFANKIEINPIEKYNDNNSELNNDDEEINEFMELENDLNNLLSNSIVGIFLLLKQ